MRVVASKRRLGRRGVEAIFTSEREQRDARFLVGLSGIVAGIAVWITLFLDLRYPVIFGSSEIGSYLSMVLASYGLILVISGVGICTTFWTTIPVDDKRELQGESNSLENPTTSFRGPSVGILSAPNFKLGLVSFIQGCIAIALYSGLADEYRSNISMQQWVRALFPFGQYLLSWEAVLGSTALLGVLVVQFLPGKALAE